jgi:hypothetical protein
VTGAVLHEEGEAAAAMGSAGAAVPVGAVREEVGAVVAVAAELDGLGVVVAVDAVPEEVGAPQAAAMAATVVRRRATRGTADPIMAGPPCSECPPGETSGVASG